MAIAPTSGPEHLHLPQLMNHLRLWCSGKPDGETDTCLLEFAIQVASNVRSTQLRSAAAAQGVNVRGLAVSAVGELFGSSGPNSPLGRALMGYLDDDATGIARFKATIVTRTTQFAHSQLELNDPNGYRIMRNLRLSYKRHPRLRVGPVGECTHVMLTGTKNLNKEGLPWPVDELVKIICKHAQASACIGDWLVSVLEEVSQDNERQAFVRTSEIEAAFRLADSLLAKGEMLSRTDDEPVSAETKHAVANAITLVSHEGRARLDRFLERGRIDTTAHNRLNLALQDMIQDISHDGEGGMSRYEYVSRHWPDLDKETYTTLLKSPFQTVVEHMYSRLGEVLGGNSK